MECADDARDIVCQLRRHTLDHFGQHAMHAGILSDPRIIQGLRDLVDQYRRTHPAWEGDNAALDAVPTTMGPRWLRRIVSIPRCTNSLSLYLFLLIDAVVCISLLKLSRAALYRWCPEFMERGADTVLGSAWLGTVLSRFRGQLPFAIAALGTGLSAHDIGARITPFKPPMS
jgi:hypothetical protein